MPRVTSAACWRALPGRFAVPPSPSLLPPSFPPFPLPPSLPPRLSGSPRAASPAFALASFSLLSRPATWQKPDSSQHPRRLSPKPSPRGAPYISMMSLAFTASQADILLQPPWQPWQGQLSASMERWESALQGVADSQIRTWSHVARPHGRSSLTGAKAVRGSYAAEGQKERKGRTQAAMDSLQGKLWLLLSGVLYASPANACIVFFLLCRSAIFQVLSCWAIAEALFAVYRYFEYQRVNKSLIQNPVPEPEEVTVLLDRILALRGDIDERQFLSGWFLGAPFEKIKRENMREFMAYAFYHRSVEELTERHREAIEGHIKRAEEVWELSFEAGHAEGLRFMAHNREPLRTLHHPLALYAWGQMVALVTGLVLRCLNFQKRQSKGRLLQYWFRPATGANVGQKLAVPRVFIHGLGIGVTPYLSFIHMLLEGHQSPMVVVELPHIALQIRKKIPSANDVIDAIKGIHAEHGLGPAQYIGHSYGSLIVAGLVRRFPELVASLGLVDPVCFLLCLPDVVYNFVYREPRGENMFVTACDTARWFLCSRELQVAQVLCRGFDWHMLHLWTDQLPLQSTVMLAGRDQIVPSKDVKRHLEKHGVKVLYHAKYQHAEYLFRPSAQRDFLNQLNSSFTVAG